MTTMGSTDQDRPETPLPVAATLLPVGAWKEEILWKPLKLMLVPSPCLFGKENLPHEIKSLVLFLNLINTWKLSLGW